MGWMHCYYAIRLEAIAVRLEAIALRMKAMAIRHCYREEDFQILETSSLGIVAGQM